LEVSPVFSSLRNKLMATYLIILLLALLIVGGYLLFLLERTAEEALEARLRAQTLLLTDMTAALFPAEPGPGPGAAVDPDQVLYLAGRTGARVTLINVDGRVLGDSHGKPADMDNHRDRPEIAAALQGREGLSSRLSVSTGEERLYLALPVLREGRVAGVVRLSLPLAEIRRQARQQWSLLVAAALAALLVAGFASWRFSRVLVEPLKPIQEMAAQVAAGEAREPLPNLGSDEVGRLGRAINDMARALKEKISEVEEGKARLETVVESIPSAIIFLGKYKNILLVNGAAEKLTGLNRRLLVGQRLEKVIRDTQVIRLVDEALAGQVRHLGGEVTFSYPARKVMELGGGPVYQREGAIAGLVMAFHDITEIRRLEKVRRDFISNVSHELKTPVTSVKGYAETLLDGALEDRATALEFVGIIDREAGRLSRLIDELLEISRMENRQVSFDIRTLDLREVMEKAYGNLLQKAENEGIRMLLETGAEPLLVRGDADKLQQVLNNLLENAVKYSPPGSQVRISYHREEEAREAVVRVSDTGPGIPPEDLTRVFERFYRVEKDRSRRQGGSGLGLAIVKHILEGHGGRVWAENNPGKGASFLFTLPLA
jgi:two-component system, OmpR family, phosphate regulon sensor histidine kinase PhoR